MLQKVAELVPIRVTAAIVTLGVRTIEVVAAALHQMSGRAFDGRDVEIDEGQGAITSDGNIAVTSGFTE